MSTRILRAVSLAVVIAMAAAGCGAATTDSAAPLDPAAEVEVVPSGRDALDVAIADGDPHVLWFWGAH